jgi:hypothetical protein
MTIDDVLELVLNPCGLRLSLAVAPEFVFGHTVIVTVDPVTVAVDTTVPVPVTVSVSTVVGSR